MSITLKDESVGKGHPWRWRMMLSDHSWGKWQYGSLGEVPDAAPYIQREQALWDISPPAQVEEAPEIDPRVRHAFYAIAAWGGPNLRNAIITALDPTNEHGIE